MEAYRLQEGLAAKPEITVRVDMGPTEARQLMEDLEKFDVEAHPGMATAALYRCLRRVLDGAARVPSDRPTDVDGLDNRPTQPAGEEPEETGRPASLPGGDLPKYIDVLASHILPANREFTVRIYRCDFSDRRDPNEALARTFPTEAKARDFYVRTQNIQNMKVRSKEAPAFDVVLGVQDRRSHAKKKSYREWEHTLCKGGPA